MPASTDTTPNLSLPYLMAAQAQKHVTHNESIRMIDALVQLSVLDRDLATPPAAPADGDRYIVAAPPTGAWSGHAGEIAAFQDGAWMYFSPREGFVAWVADEDKLVAFDGSAWVVAGGQSVNPAALVGVNATADTTNRLSVSSPATLLNHDGASHQLKINKALSGDTASLLFQTGFSGRTEIGTTGDDKLRIKMSADGTTWRDAVVVSPAGQVSVNSSAGPVTLGATTAFQVDSAFGVVGVFVNHAVPSASSGAGMIGAVFDTPTVADQRLGYLLFGSRMGQQAVGRQSAGMAAISSGAWLDLASYPTGLQLLTTAAGSTARVERLRIEADGTTRPGADNTYSFGSAAFRWAQVWAANGVIQTSDARDKQVAGRINGATAAAAVDAVAPVMFRWKIGGNELRPSATETETGEDGTAHPKMEVVAKPGKRLHAGFLAQEVKAAMDVAKADFGVWGVDDPNDPDSRQWLRPDQLIPVLWAALRETRAEVAQLRRGQEAGSGRPGIKLH